MHKMPTETDASCGPVFGWVPDEYIVESDRYIDSGAIAHMRNGQYKPARRSNWFVVKSVPVRVTVVNPYPSQKVSSRTAMQWFSLVRKITSCVDDLCGRSPIRPACMDITVYLWNRRKWLESTDTEIGSANANTGMTKHGHGKKIIVYRREESVKTLVHEILHAYHVGDWANDDEAIAESCLAILTDNGVSSATEVSPTEAVVDSLAIRISCNLFGGSSWEDCVRHSRAMAEKLLFRMSPWRQSTHAFEYYVVKAVIMTRMDDFLTAHIAGLQRPDKARVREILARGASLSPRDAGAGSRMSMRMTPASLAPPPHPHKKTRRV